MILLTFYMRLPLKFAFEYDDLNEAIIQIRSYTFVFYENLTYFTSLIATMLISSEYLKSSTVTLEPTF